MAKSAGKLSAALGHLWFASSTPTGMAFGASFRRGGREEMSESDIVRVRRLRDGTVVEELPDGTTRPIEDRTDWARLEAMTEEEIEASALADPDNPPLTIEELNRMRPVPNPRRIRERLGLTQEQFAERFEIPLDTLRDWERRIAFVDRSAWTLLRVIDKDPEAVVNALAKTYLPPLPASPDSRS
jgi:putative transcriptional regulator